jgi:DNA polymerase III delta prime subunit
LTTFHTRRTLERHFGLQTAEYGQAVMPNSNPATTTDTSSEFEQDGDYNWLMSHVPSEGALESRRELAEEVAQRLVERMQAGELPHTLGIFGSWGTGKTTFLALLARELEQAEACSIIYFNSWKYAGFMEIVPALVYKILRCGSKGKPEQRKRAAGEAILALGQKYSEQLGKWAQDKIGIDPVELFKDVRKAASSNADTLPVTPPDVISAYYTQVDRAQDALVEALGTVKDQRDGAKPVMVLIDELDRCDPDEAFTVIKQMRVLFSMRDLPVAFAVSANPEPIGLAIKHRYGLATSSGDYEARRILEKFVDDYIELGQETALKAYISCLHEGEALPWIIRRDDERPREPGVARRTAWDLMSTNGPYFVNLRVLRKSMTWVRDNARANQDLFWTKWLLEVVNQLDPAFRSELRSLSRPLQETIFYAYQHVGSSSDSGSNSFFETFDRNVWEQLKNRAATREDDPQKEEQQRAIRHLLSNLRKMDFVVLLGLLPDVADSSSPDERQRDLEDFVERLGYELSS